MLFKQKQYAESMRRVQRSLAQRQNDPEAYKLLAFNAVLLNRLDVVETGLKRALELAPDDPVAHFHRGLLYFTTNRFALAKNDFQRVTQLNPGHMKAYDMLALAEEELDEDAIIVQTYQRAIELAEQQNLKDESPYLHLAKFLWLRNTRARTRSPGSVNGTITTQPPPESLASAGGVPSFTRPSPEPRFVSVPPDDDFSWACQVCAAAVAGAVAPEPPPAVEP